MLTRKYHLFLLLILGYSCHQKDKAHSSFSKKNKFA